jgi:hypothetical protein
VNTLEEVDKHVVARDNIPHGLRVEYYMNARQSA